MDDRALLEAAAKAAGIALEWADNGRPGFWTEWRGLPQWEYWTPINDDGDALRLAVKLDIVPRRINTVVFAWRDGICDIQEPVASDPYAATRRAIVRAAAAIGDAT